MMILVLIWPSHLVIPCHFFSLTSNLCKFWNKNDEICPGIRIKNNPNPYMTPKDSLVGWHAIPHVLLRKHKIEFSFRTRLSWDDHFASINPCQPDGQESRLHTFSILWTKKCFANVCMEISCRFQSPTLTDLMNHSMSITICMFIPESTNIGLFLFYITIYNLPCSL